ncbi:MAG: hypothetical protein U0X76_07900 [Bacteroidia bacterium]
MIDYISFIDLIVPVILLVLIFIYLKRIQLKRIEEDPSYKYFIYGWLVKVVGGTMVCLIYVYYYGAGDTLNYYNDCNTVLNLTAKSFPNLFRYFFGPDPSLVFEATVDTGYFQYFNDPHASAVVKLTLILCLFSFKSFVGMTILLATISYWPIWRLYKVLIREFPDLSFSFAMALFFIPSVFFWGSGLLKDTITFAAVCLFASSFCIILIQRKAYLKNLSLMVVGSTLLLWIKPYIFFALLPGSFLWFGGIQLEKVDNKLIRSLSTPFLIVFSLISGYLMLDLMSGFLGDYSISNVLDKAVLTNLDLKSEHYQGASFDIGDFDPTIGGILSKLPAAINAALFRPYLWESYNLTMIFSGLENFIMLAFSLYLLLKLKVYNLFRLMFRHRILFFTVYFSLFFAFSVGLTTSNFGSLVRYKIPAIPFFVISLMIISHSYRELLDSDKQKFLVAEKLKPAIE